MGTRLFTKRLADFGALLALLGGLAVTAAPAAHAASTVQCSGTTSSTFTPGITLIPQTVNIHADISFGPCASTNPAITTATSVANGTGTISCLSGNATGTQQIFWNDGSQSVVTWTGLVGARPAGQSVLVINGIVTGGNAFLGGTMTETLAVITNQSAQCLTPQGVQSGGGPVVLNIIA